MRHPLQLAAVLIGLASITGCNTCGNEISQAIMSPSGGLKAVVFNRNCGATTGFNTQVSIISASDSLPDGNGNTLILDDAIPLQVQWRSDSVLHLTGLGSAEVFKQGSSVAGVSISYDN